MNGGAPHLPGESAEGPDGTVEQTAQDADTAPGRSLFVVPNKRGDGFRASVRGHMFELADPESAHGLVPTPEDLLAVAIASDIAWFARRFLRTHGLDDHVSVSARARTDESPAGPGRFEVTVEVSRQAVVHGPTLATMLEHRLATHSPPAPEVRIRQA